jgi:DNA-binding beta-propeller fold protein YncE
VGIRRTFGSAAVVGLIAAACAVALPASAQAAIGDLSFAGCIADTNAEGCEVGSLDSLEGARDVAISPDGTSIYVTSRDDGSISHLTRAASGSLTFTGCFAQTNAEGCVVPPKAALSGADSVAVSPDGTSVYVTAFSSSAISHFARAADGSLDFVNCFADTNAAGCAVGFQDSLLGAHGVAISPDGTSVYVASDSDNSVSHFARAADGTLDFRGCIADTGAEGCIVPSTPALDGATDVVVSPDGASVYVTSVFSGSVSRFTRAANGSIGFVNCIADTNLDGCTVGFQDSLAGANGIAISPDGTSLYVASANDNSISHFTRAAGGAIAFAGCLADTNVEGCIVPAPAVLAQARDVAVSPDGASVYVTSTMDGAISHFTRTASGSIEFGNCIADSISTGCPVGFQDSLDGARGVAVGPGPAGSSVYVASSGDDSVSHFVRELPPQPPAPPAPPEEPSPPQEPGGAPDLALTVTSKKGKLAAGAKAKFVAEVTNVGTAATSEVTVCIAAPKSAKGEVKAKGCKALGALVAGSSAETRLKAKTTAAAEGRYRLTLTASSVGTADATAKAKLKVKP